MKIEKILKTTFFSLLIIWALTYNIQEPEAACMAGFITGKVPCGGKIVDLNNLCTLPRPHTVFSTVTPGAGSGQWNFVYGKTYPFKHGPINSPADLGNNMLGLGSHQYMPCMKESPTGPVVIWHGGLNLNYSGKGLTGAGAVAKGGGGCILKGALVGGVVAGGVYLWNKHKKD